MRYTELLNRLKCLNADFYFVRDDWKEYLDAMEDFVADPDFRYRVHPDCIPEYHYFYAMLESMGKNPTIYLEKFIQVRQSINLSKRKSD